MVCLIRPVQRQDVPLDGAGVGVARDIPSTGETLYYFYIPAFHVTIWSVVLWYLLADIP
jgi:hypothetical protein